MLSQGLISSIEKKEEKGPKCPFLFIGTMEKYRELKFIQRETSDNITIYPRDMLKWSDVAAYKEVTGQKISLLEAGLIMGIDAIFESREDQS